MAALGGNQDFFFAFGELFSTLEKVGLFLASCSHVPVFNSLFS